MVTENTVRRQSLGLVVEIGARVERGVGDPLPPVNDRQVEVTDVHAILGKALKSAIAVTVALIPAAVRRCAPAPRIRAVTDVCKEIGILLGVLGGLREAVPLKG